MPGPSKKGARSSKRPKPNQGIGKASSYTKPAARAGQRKAAPARSNAGGAVRGQARAAQVKGLNATKKVRRVSGVVRSGGLTASQRGKSTVTNRGAAFSKRTGALVSRPKSASAGAPSSSPRPRSKPELQNYAGNPVEFLKDFFTGGAFRK